MMNIYEDMEKRRMELTGTCTITSVDGMVIVPDMTPFRRVLAIGDIHGNLARLHSLFHRMDYRAEEDLLIFLGDYIDRGEQSAECLKFVMELSEKSPHVITLTGNHEAMMLNYFENHSIREPTAAESRRLTVCTASIRKTAGYTMHFSPLCFPSITSLPLARAISLHTQDSIRK